jgi:hypothetical protein
MKHKNAVSLRIAKRIVRNILLTCGFSLIVCASVVGGLSGIVTDTKGAPVVGAHLVAVSAAQGIQTKAVTDAKGAFRFPVLAVGQYELKVEAAGFKPVTRKIVVHVDDKVRADLVLESEKPAADVTRDPNGN